LTKLAAPNTYEQSNIKTKLETGVVPVMERFEHALKTIAECPTCTENYRKKIVQSFSEMAETTEREPLIGSVQLQHDILKKSI
jgi:hypothetical protein